MSAITAGSRSASTRACSISLDEVPVMLDATEVSLTEASSSSFSKRSASPFQSPINWDR